MSEDLIYNAIFSDGHFEREKLGNLINKGGAAGKIYKSISHPELVAKIFHDRNKSKTNRLKLEAMIKNKPNIEPLMSNGKTYIQIAWPEAVLEDDEGFCVGYLMPFIDTNEAVSLDHLMQKAVRQKRGLSENYKDRLDAAFNITAMVAALHQCGHYIVDLKPANVSIYKENMTVAMFDCDGFSIKGDDTRYPAEFVSEEYIYPEGMNQSPEEMGEEQDKFALAVILFKLLNNGIHPFSGMPRKKDSPMLDIQTRIEQYHYAYGFWPDSYQYPHPYSIHEYFNKETLELFERAFCKDCKRPTAFEWQEHLWKLMHSLKKCHNNPDHVYFTSKGCGLCLIDNKFNRKIDELKKQKAEPETLRGIEIKQMNTATVQAQKEQNRIENNKMMVLFGGICAVYLVFFTFLYKILEPAKSFLAEIGLGGQLLTATLVLYGLNKLFKLGEKYFKLLRDKIVSNALLVYAFVWIAIAIIMNNDLPQDLFVLAP